MRYLKWKVDSPTPMYWCFLKAPCEMEFEFTGRLPGVLQFDSLWSFFCIEELEGLEEPSGTIKVPPPEIASLMIRAYNHWFPSIRPY